MPTWKQVLRAAEWVMRQKITPTSERPDGTLYIACVFHQERSDSLVVRDGHGAPWFCCYGCKRRGSMEEFLAWFGLRLEDVASTTDDPRQETLL